MSKYIKGLMIEQLEKQFEGVNEFLIVSTMGVGGVDNNELRGSLCEKDIKLSVVKNSIMQRALSNMGMDKAGVLLDGPCTVVYGGDNIVDVAKELVGWSKKIKAIEFKGAFVEGQLVDEAGVVALSKMPNKAELQGMIILAAKSPGSRIAGAICGPACVIAGCIKSIVEKDEKAA